MYYCERLREVGNKALHFYLLKTEVYSQLFEQKLFTNKIIQISSLLVLSQVFISLFPISLTTSMSILRIQFYQQKLNKSD